MPTKCSNKMLDCNKQNAAGDTPPNIGV